MAGPRWMGGRRARVTLVILAALALSCASASELARRSGQQLRAGDLDKAYATARQAVERDERDPAAHAALAAAAAALVQAERREVVERVAAGDTIAAADQVLALERLRDRLRREGAPVPADSASARQERALRAAAASYWYERGMESLADARPREAYRRFLSADGMVPHFRDLDTRIPRTFEKAVVRVAVLPFEDQVGIPGLAREVADASQAQLARRVIPAKFTFTRLVDPADVYGRVTVAELGRLSRDRAVAIGRALGARQVVWGRIFNLRTDTDSERWHDSIWRRSTSHDTSGRERERWVEVPFEAVTRRRHVTVQFQYEVIDTDSEEGIGGDSQSREMEAWTAYTSFSADGDCDNYGLYPRDRYKSDADPAKSAEQRWRGQFGSWTLPKFLDQARKNRGRTRYAREMRREFEPWQTRPRIFLDDLPPAEDLVSIALEDAWKPIFETLGTLDRQ